MNKVIIISFLSIFTMFLSCDEKLILVKCADCTEKEPVETALEVKLEYIHNGTIVNAQIKIYEGNIEDNVLLGTYSVYDQTWNHDVTVNKKYTLSATYKIGEATYVAIDSATPRVQYETKQCDNPCYYVYDKTVNLSIKYTKDY
jgi:hypothetical protein